jgi:hypothetical protein
MALGVGVGVGEIESYGGEVSVYDGMAEWQPELALHRILCEDEHRRGGIMDHAS